MTPLQLAIYQSTLNYVPGQQKKVRILLFEKIVNSVFKRTGAIAKLEKLRPWRNWGAEERANGAAAPEGRVQGRQNQ